MKNKKLLLSLGTIGAIVAPIASVVACGSTTDKNQVPTYYLSASRSDLTGKDVPDLSNQVKIGVLPVEMVFDGFPSDILRARLDVYVNKNIKTSYTKTMETIMKDFKKRSIKVVMTTGGYSFDEKYYTFTTNPNNHIPAGTNGKIINVNSYSSQ